jgi:hypothetical protein
MFQAFMTNTAGFYITRVLIGVFEGGFIPGAVLFCTFNRFIPVCADARGR